ncbi:MAG: hypothetical protein IKG51_04565 [Firmicutes bacterium]|nr:hypothetical protein [Bacillota bacterium]
MDNEKKSIQPGDLVFFVRTVGGKVFDGTVLAVHPDGTYKIHDASIGGTYEHIPGEHIFTDRSDAEARNEADFAAEVDAYLSMIHDEKDLLQFMFNINVALTEGQTNWAARKAAKLKAKEILDIDLIDVIDGK